MRYPFADFAFSDNLLNIVRASVRVSGSLKWLPSDVQQRRPRIAASIEDVTLEQWKAVSTRSGRRVSLHAGSLPAHENAESERSSSSP
jgi:hypothetical protein